MRIQRNVVHFGSELINDIYLLSNTDKKPYEDKVCKTWIWLADKLYPSREVSWDTTKMGISLKDFTTEAQIWLAIFVAEFLLSPI